MVLMRKKEINKDIETLDVNILKNCSNRFVYYEVYIF